MAGNKGTKFNCSCIRCNKSWSAGNVAESKAPCPTCKSVRNVVRTKVRTYHDYSISAPDQGAPPQA